MIGIFCGVIYNNKNKTKTIDYDKAVTVIKNYIELENEKKLDKAKKYVLETKNTEVLSEYYIENTNSMKFVSVKKSKVKFKNQKYIMLNGNSINVDKGIILDVTYNIDYKNNNQPEKSGTTSSYFTIVEIDGDYKIAGIGTGP